VTKPDQNSTPAGAPEKLADIGLFAGARSPLANLKELQERHGFEVYLYFDENLARNSTIEADLEDFQVLPSGARPFMPLQQFMRFIVQMEPEFERRMREEPVMVEVLEMGTFDRYSGCVRCVSRYVKGLLL
jgi:hypothetical protein